jgi:hypothetical protein
MTFNRMGADSKSGSDLGIRIPFGQQAQDFGFPTGKIVAVRPRPFVGL